MVEITKNDRFVITSASLHDHFVSTPSSQPLELDYLLIQIKTKLAAMGHPPEGAKVSDVIDTAKDVRRQLPFPVKRESMSIPVPAGGFVV